MKTKKITLKNDNFLPARIYFPAEYEDLISIGDFENKRVLYSGDYPVNNLADYTPLISLSELKNSRGITRDNIYITTGVYESLQNLLKTTVSYLPETFRVTLYEKFTLADRNRLRVGCFIKNGKSNPMFMLLYMLDVYVEYLNIHKKKKKQHLKTSTVSIKDYFEQNEDGINIPVRLKIPVRRWNKYIIRDIEVNQGILKLIILIDISDEYISNFRMAFSLNNNLPIENPEWESLALGRRTLFNDNEIEKIYTSLLNYDIQGGVMLKRALFFIFRNLLFNINEI